MKSRQDVMRQQFFTFCHVCPGRCTRKVTVEDGKYLANQYCEYTTTAAMFTYVGLYQKKATATISSTEVKSSAFSNFRVMPGKND